MYFNGDDRLGQLNILGIALPGYSQFIPGATGTQTTPTGGPTYSCPGGKLAITPNVPLYDARYAMQMNAPHPSGIFKDEYCPPELEGGQVQRLQGYSIFRAASGNIYIAGSTIGIGGWVRCPEWPAYPNLGSTLATAIHALRAWYDAAVVIYRWQIDNFPPLAAARANQYCPNTPQVLFGKYSAISRPYGTLTGRMGSAAKYARFKNYIFAKGFPDFPFYTQGGPMWTMQGPGPYAGRMNVNTIQQQAGWLSQIVDAWSSIPWPHKWFTSFLTGPKVPTPPAYGGYHWYNPDIVKSGYFPRSTEQIKKDMAQYIAKYEKVMHQNFETEMRIWAKKQEEEMKRKERTMKVLAIIGFVVDILAFGIGSIIVTPINVSIVRDMTGEMVANAKKVQNFFGITDEMIAKFKDWIVLYADLKPVAPPTRPDDPEPTGKYSFFIETNLAFYTDDIEDGIRRAYAMSEVGNRIVIKDETSGSFVNLFLREDGKLRKIPIDAAGKVQTMSKGAAESVAGKTTFPVWLPLVGIGLKVIL